MKSFYSPKNIHSTMRMPCLLLARTIFLSILLLVSPVIAEETPLEGSVIIPDITDPSISSVSPSTETYTIDSLPKLLDFSAIASDDYRVVSVQLIFTQIPEGSGITDKSLVRRGPDSANASWSIIDVSLDKWGSYTWYLSASDIAGNTANSSTRISTVDYSGYTSVSQTTGGGGGGMAPSNQANPGWEQTLFNLEMSPGEKTEVEVKVCNYGDSAIIPTIISEDTYYLSIPDSVGTLEAGECTSVIVALTAPPQSRILTANAMVGAAEASVKFNMIVYSEGRLMQTQAAAATTKKPLPPVPVMLSFALGGAFLMFNKKGSKHGF